jgi:hypothetical protein
MPTVVTGSGPIPMLNVFRPDKKRMKPSIKLIAPLILFCMLRNAYCAEHHTKQWNSSTMVGSLAHSEKMKYYLETQLRFIDDRYIFNQAFLLTGLGYQFTPAVSLFAGPGLVVTKNSEGQQFTEYRLFQQLNWLLTENKNPTSLISRTRLEQKERTNESGILWQLRQRLWLRIPIPYTNQYYYSMFDEVFFNFNNPGWASSRFFEQNRAFIGFAKQLTKNTLLDIGYLNQQQFGPPHQVSNVMIISFTTTLN